MKASFLNMLASVKPTDTVAIGAVAEKQEKEPVIAWTISENNLLGITEIRFNLRDAIDYYIKKIEELENKKAEKSVTIPTIPVIKPKKTDNTGSILWAGTGTGSLEESPFIWKKEEEKQEVQKFDYSKFSYSWNLESEWYKEILAFQDWKMYVSYDGFAYFFIMSLVWILLFRFCIKWAIELYKIGFNFLNIKWWKKL